jgi:PAS domain S-box-containing protein
MRSLALMRFTFLTMAAVLVISLAAAWWVGRTTIRMGEEIVDGETTLRHVQKILSTMQDAETGQRGFLLTGRQLYLEPYESAVEDLPADLLRLRALTVEGQVPADLSRDFQRLIEEKIGELRSTIQLARDQGVASAVNMVLTNEGISKMDAIRAVYEKISHYEESRLHDARLASEMLARLRTWVFIAAAILNLGFLAWAYRRIRREMDRRQKADLEAHRHREILAVSLASIGDAVILTDTEAKIVFMNEVAEQVTGWSRSEAIGLKCSKVFRILNETTRAPVESPVDLVLRSGKVVGLANHTLLVRKDGTEVPIDDSGAPVRKPEGVVRGVILVFRDFSKHKATENELLALKDRLQAANKAKDEFLATLSHELRTPLTPVLATLSSWAKDSSLPAAMMAEVEMLSRNVHLEARLIDDLLDLTRISRGRLTLQKEEIDMHTLLAGVVEMSRHTIDMRGIRVALRAAAVRHFVQGDPARLQQVFWNIIGNAVKFTPDGGRIEIVTANEKDNLRVTIADNGRGMTKEAIDHLFQPFERTSERAGYQPGGLGIGLTISQNLMLAHGGRIEARSAGPGLGSTFVTCMTALTTNPKTIATAPPGESHNGDTRRALSLLLVEDHEDTAMVIARLMRGLGHQTQTSHTVADALGKLHTCAFDLVLTDIGLPDGTGIELLSQARDFCATPMVALTGYGMEDDLARYREAGFIVQLTKPIRFEQLEQLLTDFGNGNIPASGLAAHSSRNEE